MVMIFGVKEAAGNHYPGNQQGGGG